MRNANKRKYLLIPVNFDEKGASVMNYGITLARELGFNIKLLHVMTMAGIPAPVEAHPGAASHHYFPGDLVDERRKQAEEKLRAIAKRVKEECGLECHFSCKFGFTDIQVLKQSENDEIAMVIMGTPHHDTVLDQLLGSRSLKIVNHGTTPVLLVPNLTGYLPIKKIVVGANYENWHKRKIKWLADTAGKLKASLHFIRVVEKLDNEQKLMFKGYQKQVMESLPVGLDHQFKILQEQSVDQGVRDYANHNQADLIALQRSEKSGWEHFFSDHVSKDVVLGTSLPILVY